jgi:hypothetical protein
MGKILLGLHGASRAETPLLFFDTDTHTGFSKTEGNLLLAVQKTRAHPAEAEPDCFFFIHHTTNPGCAIAFSTIIRFQ